MSCAVPCAQGCCWNCKNRLEEPENGMDFFEPPLHERRMYPMPERPPSAATIRELCDDPEDHVAA